MNISKLTKIQIDDDDDQALRNPHNISNSDNGLSLQDDIGLVTPFPNLQTRDSCFGNEERDTSCIL